MATVLKTKFQLRRGNAEVWARNNPILERGEPGFEIDTGRLKIGNGQTAWNDLEYLAPQSGAGGGVQPDWNQNDNTQPDYVKNRPFYTGDPVETVFVEESTVSFTIYDGMYSAGFRSTVEATVGETYKVSWDGTVYECTCASFKGIPAIGNLSIVGAGSDTGEPFFMGVNNGVGIEIYTADTSASHTFSISRLAQEIVKIDEKYLPEKGLEIPNDGDDGQILTRTTDGIAWKNAPTPPTPQISTIDDPVVIRCVSDAFGHAVNGRLEFTGRNSSMCGEIYAGQKDLFIAAIGNNNLILKTYSQIEVKDNNDNLATILAKTRPITSEYSVNEVATCGAIKQQMWNGKELFLNSSTAGSTKKFAITVDDSGTLSATEVTEVTT